MPMVWYVPPLSPVVDILKETGHDGENKNNLFGAIDTLRIPIEYLAELFTAGEVGPVRAALQRLAAMRAYMRSKHYEGDADESLPGKVGMTGGQIDEMYRLMAIANYEDRFVIPTTHREYAEDAWSGTQHRHTTMLSSSAAVIVNSRCKFSPRFAGVDRPPGTSRCSVDSGVTGQGAIVGRRLRTTVTENR